MENNTNDTPYITHVMFFSPIWLINRISHLFLNVKIYVSNEKLRKNTCLQSFFIQAFIMAHLTSVKRNRSIGTTKREVGMCFSLKHYYRFRP